ncbi:bifunctional UDP-sugar hydrolase/5'-nucleotidase UshA [Vibrio casei]|uniref:5'-nucleotidase n=1 Tax=Vibrio casei TaxID=673372 RepID=A0A368LQB0_9VIBR|nr:bifunctional UDP-sugar hydrolase/5'-nucleotidase UshA [Vibrio casei]RCS73673.1 bifunctional UDP-sugar hydrolase/5'-nucleotidase [Vibrio casei]SJN16349.1 UDP-sugar hydrolase; 5'-nucleotidase [Vibrio casei]
MKYWVLKTATIAIAVASIVGCSSQSDSNAKTEWQANKLYKLTVLHTNDNHGRFWHNQDGEYGMAARKALVDSIRQQVSAEGGSVLLFSGGDINTGVPESDLQDAEPDFKGMNKIGYDAMAVGNHEFDNPLSVLMKQRDWSNFPMLSANIYDKKTGKRLFEPYKIFEEQGIKIAVIGLTTEDTAKIGNPEYIGGIEFRDPKLEAKKVIADLEINEKPDLIFAVTHMGHYDNGNSGVNAPGDVTLARYLPKGELDMIIGGHSQEPVCMKSTNHRDSDYKPGEVCVPDQQNGTWIVQAHEWGKYVGRADFEFQNGQLNMVSYGLIPVNLKENVIVNGKKTKIFVQKEIIQDQELKDFLQPYQDKGQEQLNVQISYSNSKLEGDRNVVRYKQTNLGRLIGMSHMERVNADFAVMNSGGVRDSIAAGDITYKDVLKVQPFGNIVTYMDMKGSELLDYLNVLATKPVDSGAYVQFAGISMTVAKDKVSNVVIGGKQLDPNKVYRFSIPSFNAAGGDGYPKIDDKPGFVNTGFVDAEVLKDYLEKHNPINAADYEPDGEIKYLK